MSDLTRRLLLAALPSAFAASALMARAAPLRALSDVIAARDVEALERWAGTSDEMSLAKGSALALRHKDKAAIAALTAFVSRATAPAPLKAAALSELAGVYMRNGAFAQAGAALTQAMSTDPDTASDDLKQTLGFVSALSTAPAMTIVTSKPDTLPLTRDKAGLLRAEIRFGETSQTCVLDSGAAFSTVTQTTAQRLGLTFLTTSATVDSVSRSAIATRFAIAKSLKLGALELRDVVFIVLPDESLSFAGGQYTIEAIIGLPVFIKLGRLDFSIRDHTESLSFDPNGTTAGTPNLILTGVQPLVLAHTSQGHNSIRLFIDTGAKKTRLHRKLIEDYPDLSRNAERKAATVGGAGGTSTDENALSLPEVSLDVGGRYITLKEVSVLAIMQPDRHGEIGQDLLNQGTGFILDFNSMIFRLKP